MGVEKGGDLLLEEVALEGAYSTDFCHPIHRKVATEST
jgi:hypothetical protein